MKANAVCQHVHIMRFTYVFALVLHSRTDVDVALEVNAELLK